MTRCECVAAASSRMFESIETFLRCSCQHVSVTQDCRSAVVTYSVQREKVDRDVFGILSIRCNRVEYRTMTGRVPEAGREFLFFMVSPAMPSMAGITQNEHALPLYLKITEG